MDLVMESRRKMLRAEACERPWRVATCSGERASRNGRQRYASSQMLRGPCARKRAQSVAGWLMLLSLASCPQLSGAPASVSLRGQRTGSDLGEASGPELVASCKVFLQAAVEGRPVHRRAQVRLIAALPPSLLRELVNFCEL